MKAIKERRKAATDVGLRAGHAIETAIIDPIHGVESTRIGSSDADNVAKAEPAKVRWHKLSELSARKSTTTANDKTDRRGGRHVVSVERETDNRWWGDSANDIIARTSGGKRKEIVWYPQISAKAITSESGAAFLQDAKRQRKSYEDRLAQIRRDMLPGEGYEPWEVPTWASTGNDTGGDGVIEIAGMKVCQFEDCARKATFGVNGIVRYW